MKTTLLRNKDFDRIELLVTSTFCILLLYIKMISKPSLHICMYTQRKQQKGDMAADREYICFLKVFKYFIVCI